MVHSLGEYEAQATGPSNRREDSPEIQEALHLFFEFEMIMRNAATFSEGTRQIWELGSRPEMESRMEALDIQHLTVVHGYLEQHTRELRADLRKRIRHEAEALKNTEYIRAYISEIFIPKRLAHLMRAGKSIEFHEASVHGKTNNEAVTTAGRNALLQSQLLIAGEDALAREAMQIVAELTTAA